MDIQAIFEAFMQFLTDFFAALGKFLGVDVNFEDLEEDDADAPAGE